MLGVLPVGLNEVSFVLGILPADPGELLRFKISLVLKADIESLKMIFFVLGIFIVDL